MDPGMQYINKSRQAEEAANFKREMHMAIPSGTDFRSLDGTNMRSIEYLSRSTHRHATNQGNVKDGRRTSRSACR